MEIGDLERMKIGVHDRFGLKSNDPIGRTGGKPARERPGHSIPGALSECRVSPILTRDHLPYGALKYDRKMLQNAEKL